MKILKIILITVLILFVLGFIGLFIFLKTLDVNRYKPQIISAANSALHRTLDFNKIDLKPSITNGIRFAISDVKISENSAFGTGDFFNVDEVFVSVNVLSYLMKKEIAITKVLVKSPRVTIIRDKDGLINAQTLAAAPVQNPPASDEPQTQQPQPPAKPAEMPNIFVDTVEISGGEVTFIDRSFEPEMKVSMSQADLKVNGFSLNAPFKISFAMAVFGSQQNIWVDGKAKLDPKTSAINLSQLNFKTDLDKISFETIRQLPVIPTNVPFPTTLGGQFSVLVKELSAGPQGLSSIDADIKFENGKVAIPNVAPGVSFAASKINVSVNSFSLSKSFQWNVSAAYLSEQSNINVQGNALLDMTNMGVRLTDVSVKTDLASYSLAQLQSDVTMLKGQPLPDKLAGKIQLDLNEFSAGPAGLTALSMNLNFVDGEVSLKDKSGAALSVQAINFALKNFSLNGPFSFSLKAGVMNPTPNVALDGQGDFNLTTQAIHLKDTTFETDLAGFSLAEIKASVPALKDIPLPEKLAGKCKVSIKDMAAGPLGLQALTMDAALSDGQVAFKEIAPGVSVDVSKAKLNINNFSMNGEPFDVQGELAYLSDQPNFSFATKATLNQQTQQITVDRLNFKTDLSLLSLEQLKQTVVALKDAPLPTELKGLASVNLSSLMAGPTGLGPVNGIISLTDGRVVLKELNAPVDPVQAKIQIVGTNVTMDEIVLHLGEGNISITGSLTDYVKEQSYQSNLKITNLSLADVLNQKDFPVKVEGVIDTTLAIQGHGFDPAIMMNALTGEGVVAFKEGKLVDINILALVLDNIKFISNFKEIIVSSLPPELKTKIENKDTVITGMNMTINIANGVAQIQSFNLEADGFIFEGNGQVGFDQHYSFNGIFKIEQQLSSYMVKAVGELNLLYDDSGRISFPLLISGSPSGIKVLPDIKDLAKNAIKNKALEFLQKNLDKNGVSSDQTTSPTEDSVEGDQPPEENEKAPEQILIEGVLDSIFK